MRLLIAILFLVAIVAALYYFLKGEFLGSIAGSCLGFLMLQTLKALEDDE